MQNLKDREEFETFVVSFPPSLVAEVCGVSEENVKETARVFSASKSSVAVIDGLTNSRDAQAAVMILNLLVGSVGRNGGVAVRREVPTSVAKVKNIRIHQFQHLFNPRSFHSSHDN